MFWGEIEDVHDMNRWNWVLVLFAIVALFASMTVVACGDEEEDKVSEDEKESCREDCDCKYNEICMEGCALWAAGDSLLALGCSGDCDYERAECKSECGEDDESSWDGIGPFGADWYDWNDLIDQANC